MFKIRDIGNLSTGILINFHYRKLNEKHRAFIHLAGSPNLTAVDVHNRFGDGETQSAGLGWSVAGVGGFHPVKALENVG